jgi:hypothetical protein
MKKLKLLLFISLLFSYKTFAQDLQSVQRFIAVNDYASAKEQIDSLLSDPSQRQEAAPWFYKGKIYTEVARRKDSASPLLLTDALKAYQRYQELDSRNTLMSLDNNVGLFQLYDLSYNKGVENYNQEEYAMAFHHFKNALQTENYIFKKNFSFNGKQLPALDTQLISLTAFSAYLSGNEVEAIPYFEKLADIKISGAEYKGVYTVLYQFHSRNNSTGKAAKYLDAGRKIFNDEEYWIKLEMGNPKTAQERMNRYEEMLKKYPGSSTLYRNYAIDLFNLIYAGEKVPDHIVKQDKLQQVLNKLIKLDSASAISNYIMSQHVLNQLYDLQELINAGHSTEESRLKVIRDKISRKNDELIMYAEKAFKLYTTQTALNEEDRSNCKKLLNNLVAGYQEKRDPEKENYYREILKKYQ